VAVFVVRKRAHHFDVTLDVVETGSLLHGGLIFIVLFFVYEVIVFFNFVPVDKVHVSDILHDFVIPVLLLQVFQYQFFADIDGLEAGHLAMGDLMSDLNKCTFT
jgi:hypothetical protein